LHASFAFAGLAGIADRFTGATAFGTGGLLDEDAGLSEKELAAGYVLCCVSRPLSEDIKIIIE
jgi:hypothetical protein